MPTTSNRIDQNVSEYQSNPLSPTIVVSVDNLVHHLAVGLNLEPSQLRQEIASFCAFNYPDNVPIETAKPSPRLFWVASSQKGTVFDDPWTNGHAKAEPYLAQRSESQGHNRSFSFQRGDDPGFVMPSKEGQEVYDAQRLLNTCLPGAQFSCREQDQASMTLLLISLSAKTSDVDVDEHDKVFADNPETRQGQRELSTRSVITAIKQASIRSSQSSRSSVRKFAKSQDSSMGAADNNMLAILAARTADARDSFIKGNRYPV